MAPKKVEKTGATVKAKAAPTAKTADISAEKKRVLDIIEALAQKAPPKIAPYLSQAAPVIASIWLAILVVFPYIMQAVAVVSKYAAMVPHEYILPACGFFICFFGGVFPATIATFEAYHHAGGFEALGYCKKLYVEFVHVLDAERLDDKKDDDKDGIADVDQMDARTLIQHKSLVAMAAIDPSKVNESIAGLYAGWICVLGVLKIQFARTIVLGNAIGDRLYSVAKYSEPVIKKACPADLEKWVPFLVKWVCKSIAISIAWWIQRIQSAAHAAVRGGHMMADFALEMIKKNTKVDLEEKFGERTPEAICWILAAMGILFQFFFRFGVPFPLNFITWPLSIVEWFIIWSIQSGPSPTM